MLALTILKSPVLHPLTGTIYRIASVEPILIGRASKAQIRIIHPKVSRRHAQLIPLNKSWCLRNLSKKNPTVVNGDIVEDNIELKCNDKIRIGTVLLEVSAMSWLKNSIEVTEPIDEALLNNSIEITEPVIEDDLSRSEAEGERSSDELRTMAMEFESLDFESSDFDSMDETWVEDA